MHLDLFYVFTLPSGMRVIPCYFDSEMLFWPAMSYIIPQRPPESGNNPEDRHAHTHMVAPDRYEPQMVPIRDSNRHTRATTIPLYVPLHMVRWTGT